MPHRVPGARQPRSRPLYGETAVFLHAHPDDEGIFTGGTIRRLADAGARVVLVCATNGELGNPLTALDRAEALPTRRLAELELACAELGVSRLVPADYRDSGMTGDLANRHPRAFCRARTATVARWLADLCEAEGAETLVHYDPGGIYPHPDHVKVHLVGAATAAISDVATYEATVDRQVLGNDARHLVHRPELGHASVYGSEGAAIDLAVPVGPALAAKRTAMAKHASQIPVSALALPEFATTYGVEWFIRRGRPGALDRLMGAAEFAA